MCDMLLLVYLHDAFSCCLYCHEKWAVYAIRRTAHSFANNVHRPSLPEGFHKQFKECRISCFRLSSHHEITRDNQWLNALLQVLRAMCMSAELCDLQYFRLLIFSQGKGFIWVLCSNENITIVVCAEDTMKKL